MRVNALDTGLTLDDLASVVRPGLDAIMVPKANGAADIERIGHDLDALEAGAGMLKGAVKFAVVATETAKAMFAPAPMLRRIRGSSRSTWGVEDLSAALGATANKEPDGAWTFPYQVARAQCLFAASASRLRRSTPSSSTSATSRALSAIAGARGATALLGRMAIHPDQVATINRSYGAVQFEIEHARKIVAAFDANPGAGTLGVDGKMGGHSAPRAATNFGVHLTSNLEKRR